VQFRFRFHLPEMPASAPLSCFKPSAAFGILVILVSIRFIACYLLIQFLSYFNILLGFFSFFKTIRYHFGRTKIKTADDYQLLVF